MIETMEEIFLSILSSAVYDIVKGGLKITGDYLKEKLSNWILSDANFKRVEEAVNTIPHEYLMSEGIFKEYLKIAIKDISEAVVPKSMEQYIENNHGIIIQNGSGNISLYSDGNQPRVTQHEILDITKDYVKFRAIQTVKSFSGVREECVVKENDKVVCAEIEIPSYVKEKAGCEFEMILFNYIPSENWLNYFDEKYRLEFGIDRSNSIRQIQLQIKNSKRQAFVDLKIKGNYFSRPLSQMARRDAWKDIREICFTVFADEDYITGENGVIRIRGLQLSNG